MHYLLKMRSITTAQRAVKLLRKMNVSASIGRLKNPKPNEGCGYTVSLKINDIAPVIQYLNNHGVPIVEVVKL